MKKIIINMKNKLDNLLKFILEFPAIFGLIISIFFIVLSIILIILFFVSLITLAAPTILDVNKGNINSFFIEIIITSKILLTSLLFIIISYGIIRMIFIAKVYKYDLEFKNEFEKKLKEEKVISNSNEDLSINGILPFKNINSIESLEKYIFGIFALQFVILLIESFSSGEKYLILISKGISASFIIISLSIYLYLSDKK